VGPTGVDAINTFGVSAGRFASFCVLKFRILAARSDFQVWFDSRQLHEESGPWRWLPEQASPQVDSRTWSSFAEPESDALSRG
jgi:hypothetical protein